MRKRVSGLLLKSARRRGRANDVLPARLSMVTLGVKDIKRSRKFYEELGFVASGFESDSVVFFQASGTVLGLYGHDALAEDANETAKGEGFRGVAIAWNLASEPDVDAALTHAQSCGAELIKPAQKVFWGGYSGYFKDPDGHLWEVAHNPFVPLDDNGHMVLPPPKT